MQTVSRRRFLEGSAIGIAAAGLGAPPLGAQDWARQAVDKSPRRHERVAVRYGARSVDSFVAYPLQPGKAPAAVIIHDVIAMAPWVENVAERQMKAAGKFYDPVTYGCASHGFMQSGARPDAPEADKKARDAAWINLKAIRSRFD